MRISDWSSDVCSSDLSRAALRISQQPDQKAEQESLRQSKWLARKDKRVAGGIKFPNYGRSAGLSYGREDRKSIVKGKRVSVRVDLGGRRIIKKIHNSKRGMSMSI